MQGIGNLNDNVCEQLTDQFAKSADKETKSGHNKITEMYKQSFKLYFMTPWKFNTMLCLQSITSVHTSRRTLFCVAF
jgi:hypothetical protein